VEEVGCQVGVGRERVRRIESMMRAILKPARGARRVAGGAGGGLRTGSSGRAPSSARRVDCLVSRKATAGVVCMQSMILAAVHKFK
jgi:hypothetical protein